MPRNIRPGLPPAVLPYGEALAAISTTLVALCLNTGGLAAVRRRRLLHAYVPIFTTSKCVQGFRVLLHRGVQGGF